MDTQEKIKQDISKIAENESFKAVENIARKIISEYEKQNKALEQEGEKYDN